MKHDVDQLLYEIDTLKRENKSLRYMIMQLDKKAERLADERDAEREAYVNLRLRHHLQDRDDWKA